MTQVINHDLGYKIVHDLGYDFDLGYKIVYDLGYDFDLGYKNRSDFFIT